MENKNIFAKIAIFISSSYLLFIILLTLHNDPVPNALFAFVLLLCGIYRRIVHVDYKGVYDRFAKLLLVFIYLILIPTLFYTLYQILTSRV